MFPELDPLLHNQLRLQIMTLLVSVEEGEFNWLLTETGATRGNLSAQITKLKGANYLTVEKGFRNNYPLTTCKTTPEGKKAFEAYVAAISAYFDKTQNT